MKKPFLLPVRVNNKNKEKSGYLFFNINDVECFYPTDCKVIINHHHYQKHYELDESMCDFMKRYIIIPED